MQKLKRHVSFELLCFVVNLKFATFAFAQKIITTHS